MRWNQQWWNHQGAVELDKVRWNQQQPHSKSSTVRRKAAECVNLILEKSTILCRPVGPTRLQWTDCTVHDVVGDQCALLALYALCALVHLCTCVHVHCMHCLHCLHCTLCSRSELTVGSSPPDHKASPTCLLLSSSPTLLSSLSF